MFFVELGLALLCLCSWSSSFFLWGGWISSLYSSRDLVEFDVRGGQETVCFFLGDVFVD